MQGVILSPSLPSTETISDVIPVTVTPVSIKVGIGFILAIVVGFVSMVYYFTVSNRSLRDQLLNAQNDLTQAKSQYAAAFQEKTLLQTSLASKSGSVLGDSKVQFSSTEFPVTFISGESQKVAQSFKPNSSSPVSLVSLQLFANSASGGNLLLRFYEMKGLTVDAGEQIAEATISAKNIFAKKGFNFTFEKPVIIDPKKEYAFIVEAKEASTEADLVFTDVDSDNTGMMYEYIRVFDEHGDLINTSRDWIARKNQDLKYNAMVNY